MYKLDLSQRWKFDSNETLWNMKTETGKSSHCRERSSREEREGMGCSCIDRLWITPVDRIISECLIEGNVREREGAAGISTGRCLRGA